MFSSISLILVAGRVNCLGDTVGVLNGFHQGQGHPKLNYCIVNQLNS